MDEKLRRKTKDVRLKTDNRQPTTDILIINHEILKENNNSNPAGGIDNDIIM